jgi:hypothetical protein
MAAHTYWYFARHQEDVNAALDSLRETEFQAGRYNPVMPFIEFPITDQSPAPGAQHSSPDEAMADAEEDGTRSILDIMYVAEIPGFCTAAPLDEDRLLALYGTNTPSRSQVEQNMDFMDEVERGHCVYFPVYENNEPREIFFGGISFD